MLRTAVGAATRADWRLVLAHGSSPIDRLGALPPSAVVERHVRQVAWLQHTDVLVTHGGNGSVTEAAATGVPMVVLPFSTDQFAGAAAIERAGLGMALAPNEVTVDALVAAVDEVTRSGAADRRGRLPARSPRTAARTGPSLPSRCTGVPANHRRLTASCRSAGQGRRPNQNSEPVAASTSSSSDAPANQSVTSRRSTFTCRLRPRS